MAICSTVSHDFIHVRFYPQGSPAHPPLLRHPFPFFHFLPCHQSRGHSCVFGPRFTDSGRNLVCFQSSHILLHGNLHVISCSLEFDPIPLRSRNKSQKLYPLPLLCLTWHCSISPSINLSIPFGREISLCLTSQILCSGTSVLLRFVTAPAFKPLIEDHPSRDGEYQPVVDAQNHQHNSSSTIHAIAAMVSWGLQFLWQDAARYL